MREVLMQFAQREDSNSIVDVASVPRGEACGCVCLSCGMTVVAKKGDVNAHHFSHLAKADLRNTACEYSFDVALRAMVRSVLGAKPALLLPSIDSSLPNKLFIADSVKIRTKQGDESFEAVLFGGEYQLCIKIGAIKRHRRLTKKSKNPLRAVLLLDPGAQVHSILGRGDYRASLETWLSEDIQNKHWLEHPKASEIVPERLQKKRQWAGESSLKNRQDTHIGTDNPFYRAKRLIDGVKYKCQVHGFSWVGQHNCPECGSMETPRNAVEVNV